LVCVCIFCVCIFLLFHLANTIEQQTGGNYTIVTISEADPNNWEKGVVGNITLYINSSATPAPTTGGSASITGPPSSGGETMTGPPSSGGATMTGPPSSDGGNTGKIYGERERRDWRGYQCTSDRFSFIAFRLSLFVYRFSFIAFRLSLFVIAFRYRCSLSLFVIAVRCRFSLSLFVMGEGSD
jgi:hypothetical protein